MPLYGAKTALYHKGGAVFAGFEVGAKIVQEVEVSYAPGVKLFWFHFFSQ